MLKTLMYLDGSSCEKDARGGKSVPILEVSSFTSHSMFTSLLNEFGVDVYLTHTIIS